MEYKICTKCNENKPVVEFYRHKKHKDGLRYSCKTCYKISRQRRVAKDPNYYQKLYEKNKENFSEYHTKYRLENKDRISKYGKKYYSKNAEIISEKVKKRRQENLEHFRFISKTKEGKRRASKLKRVPLWANLKAIKEFYQKCPEGHHVDHIIPLKGKIVSGLHVKSNLQYLTASENLKKSNKFEGL